MQLAVHHGNYEGVHSLIRCPAAKELGPDGVLRLVLQLMHAWDDGSLDRWSQEEWQTYTGAIKDLLFLPGGMDLNAQECSQVADVAVQRGKQERESARGLSAHQYWSGCSLSACSPMQHMITKRCVVQKNLAADPQCMHACCALFRRECRCSRYAYGAAAQPLAFRGIGLTAAAVAAKGSCDSTPSGLHECRQVDEPASY